MPPNSKELWEEGAVIKSFKVVENGIFKEEELTELLMAPGKIEGCQGTRCLRDNISDIKAQAAANHRGSQLIHALIEDYGLEAVQFYSKPPIQQGESNLMTNSSKCKRLSALPSSQLGRC
jgi:5-oxoprolinase (ATP-hydrolysing)